MKIELPAPRLEPGLTLVLAPVTAALGVLPALPAPMIPSRPRVPVISPVASRENVRHPLSGLHPGLRAQLEAVKKDKKEDWRAELGAELFDGRLVPSRKRPVPVQPSVVIGLPEVELEKEIGAY